MPEISRFYGIIIKMYFRDSEHNPPHFHAIYGERIGEFNLKTLEMMQGDLPSKAQKLVMEWAMKHKKELMIIWNTQNFREIQPLE